MMKTIRCRSASPAMSGFTNGKHQNKKPTPMNRLEEIAMRARAGSGQNQFSFIDGVHK